MTGERSVLDRVNPWLPLASVVVGVILVGAVLVVGAWSQSAANNSDQVRRGNELAACRGDVFATLTDADAALDQARADWDLVYGDGLVAVLENDEAAQAAAVAAIPVAAENVSAAREQVRAASDAYREAARLAVEDPEALLAACRGDG